MEKTKCGKFLNPRNVYLKLAIKSEDIITMGSEKGKRISSVTREYGIVADVDKFNVSA